MKYLLTIAIFCTINCSLIAQKNDRSEGNVVIRELPKSWGKLVAGAQFMDRFLPMPKGKLTEKVWGGANVLPRYVDNGIETNETSFWGGNILKGNDDKYHFFICGWAESNKRGHRNWGRSYLYHAVADNSIGPFKVQDTLGYGHNPDTYRLTDGRYISYIFTLARGSREFGYFIAPTIKGPWKYHLFEFDGRDRNVRVKTNFTFAKREDGSFLGVAKDGTMWLSKDGISKYQIISDQRAYPKIPGYMEDPALWKDNVQYNMIVNDAKGRVAYYLRSKNGVDWIWEDGIAYKPGFTKHEDGHLEDWHKYERVKIFQDELGRAIQANFAVLDTYKGLDKGSDNHSSKNISVPLNKGILMSWEGKENVFPENKINPIIRIKAEVGFNPFDLLDISSLRFGDAKEVNYGRGSKVIKSKRKGKDLILTFDAEGHKIDNKEFAPKLLGKNKKGGLIYGYTRLPWVLYDASILSARKPTITEVGSVKKMTIEVENFGLLISSKGVLVIREGNAILCEKVLPSIEPYQKVNIIFNDVNLSKGIHNLNIEIEGAENYNLLKTEIDVK